MPELLKIILIVAGTLSVAELLAFVYLLIKHHPKNGGDDDQIDS